MNRRTFLTTTLFAAPCVLSGCNRTPGAPASESFSRTRLHAGLDALRFAFEAKSLHVSDGLLPPIAKDALQQQCRWFPSPLPDELIALYEWRGGQRNETWNTAFPFWFRDCGFASPKTAEQSYRDMMRSYGRYPPDREMLEHAFPFAEFNGGWLVLPCGPHHAQMRWARPVYSIHEGVNVWFRSIQAMVDTCIDWVGDPGYDGEERPSRDVEQRIWRQHNPGVFDGT